MTGKETSASPLHSGRGVVTLDEIERLARAATPGPWFYDSYSRIWQSSAHEVDEALAFVPVECGDTATTQGKHDAAYIAAVHPQAILDLIARVRELEEMLTWLNRRGRLGLDVHARITAILGEEGNG